MHRALPVAIALSMCIGSANIAAAQQPAEVPELPAGDTSDAPASAEPTADTPPAAGTTPAAGTMPAPSTTTAEGQMDASTYAVRLRDLQRRIDELKEQIFRSKARLSLLAETVLATTVAGAHAVITHRNEMGASFRLVRVVYALDGAPIFNKVDEDGNLSDRDQFDVFNGSIVPGDHTLTVNLEYRGHGFGIFSYLKGYRFKVRSTHSFTVPESKTISIRVVGYEKGPVTLPLEERPAIRYVERVTAGRRGGGGGEGGGGGGEGGGEGAQ